MNVFYFFFLSAQMDAQQVEQQTWADRWYQNKGIQKIVKDSSLHSKVRKQIKTKNKSDDTTEKVIEEAPGTSAKGILHQFFKADSFLFVATENNCAKI